MRIFISDALCERNEKIMPYLTLMCTTLDPVENVTNVPTYEKDCHFMCYL